LLLRNYSEYGYESGAGLEESNKDKDGSDGESGYEE
jgi:hypothetical protein